MALSDGLKFETCLYSFFNDRGAVSFCWTGGGKAIGVAAGKVAVVVGEGSKGGCVTSRSSSSSSSSESRMSTR